MKFYKLKEELKRLEEENKKLKEIIKELVREKDTDELIKKIARLKKYG